MRTTRSDKGIRRPNQGTHKMTYTRFWRIYRSMLARCNCKTHISYKYYGGKGIQVLWKTFEEFRDDMLPTYKEGLTIDRIDNDGDYCKENCRWATHQEQEDNKEKRIHLLYEGKYILLQELARMFGISKSTIHDRYQRGFSIEKIIYQGKHKKPVRVAI